MTPGRSRPRRFATLPVPVDGLARARRDGLRRRRRAGVAVAAAVVAVAGVGTAVPLLLAGGTPSDRLVAPAAPAAPAPAPVAGRIVGVVLDRSGRPLAGIRVLPRELGELLDRTDVDGRFSAPCRNELLLASYVPSRRDDPILERSPGAADVAWRRLPTATACGTVVSVVLPPGGVVEGRVAVDLAGQDVRLVRLVDAGPQSRPEGPVFASRVRADGTWRVDGLDTGRYRVQSTGVGPADELVDVREGAVTRTLG